MLLGCFLSGSSPVIRSFKRRFRQEPESTAANILLRKDNILAAFFWNVAGKDIVMNLIETNLSFGSLSMRTQTKRIILHHSATSGETVEQIHEYHKKIKGWSGIAYHFYVRKDGTIYRGRPLDTVGAHASGNNSDSVGVCFEGNFENEQMSQVQKQSGKELVAFLKKKYGIDLVQTHQQVRATACPGKNFPFDEIAGKTDNITMPEFGELLQEKEILDIDGRWGSAMTRRLQNIFGTIEDGKVSHQHNVYKEKNPGLSEAAWEWEEQPDRGSALIMAVQRYLNEKYNLDLEENGWIGPLTIKALQAWMGTEQDGYFSRVSSCIKKLQEWANAQN